MKIQKLLLYGLAGVGAFIAIMYLTKKLGKSSASSGMATGGSVTPTAPAPPPVVPPSIPTPPSI